MDEGRLVDHLPGTAVDDLSAQLQQDKQMSDFPGEARESMGLDDQSTPMQFLGAETKPDGVRCWYFREMDATTYTVMLLPACTGFQFPADGTQKVFYFLARGVFTQNWTNVYIPAKNAAEAGPRCPCSWKPLGSEPSVVIMAVLTPAS